MYQRVAKACGVPERARGIIAQVAERVEACRLEWIAFHIDPRCFLMEWVDPPFCSGH